MDISVVIPTYHTQSYLAECLNSLEKQTFDHSRFEIIIVLNGEERPYMDIVDKSVGNLKNISVRKLYTACKGVSNARNMAIDAAKGMYVCFIDDDDFVAPTFLESAFNVMDGREDVVVQSNVLYYLEEENRCAENYISRAFYNNKARTHPSLLSLRSFTSFACAKLIPRKIIGNRRFPVEFKRLEDAMFMAMLTDKIKTVLLTSADAVYYYRMRQGSASHARLSLCDFLHENLLQMAAFVRIYLSNPRAYDFLFFCTRIMAICRTVLRRLCHVRA